MARQARIKSEFGTFHIVQFGGGCRTLFTCNDDREKFLYIVHKAQKKFNFILHGYCLLDQDRYDLLIDVNGSDLSKIMKSINIAYAMYAKCDGKLFSDRYKSKLLESIDAIKQIKDEIQAFKKDQVDKRDYSICFESPTQLSSPSINLDDCNNCIKCMDTAISKLQQIASEKGVSMDTLIQDKDIRNELIINFRKSSTLSLKSIGDLFGGLSESSVSKIISTSSN